MTTRARPARCSSATDKSDTAILQTQRRSLARRNNGLICFDGSGTTCAVISESSLWLWLPPNPALTHSCGKGRHAALFRSDEPSLSVFSRNAASFHQSRRIARHQAWAELAKRPRSICRYPIEAEDNIISSIIPFLRQVFDFLLAGNTWCDLLSDCFIFPGAQKVNRSVCWRDTPYRVI